MTVCNQNSVQVFRERSHLCCHGNSGEAIAFLFRIQLQVSMRLTYNL
ncbi:hypothetical protein NDA06_08830 [Trichocoleus sp. ST-U1]